MESDKILIILASIIVLTSFVFKESIAEEVQIFRRSEIRELAESFPQIYFSPLSQQERREALISYLEKIRVIQQRISKTTFSKYFIDFSDHILDLRKELSENKIGTFFGEEAISFTTGNYNSVIANPEFSKEQLLKIGALITRVLDKQNIEKSSRKLVGFSILRLFKAA